MADTLTSLLNSAVSKGDDAIDDSLLDLLATLDDGSYAVANGTLTLNTAPDEVDTITGDFTNNSALLLGTEWFTGQEAPSQGLIDTVTGAADTSAYFAFDTDEQVEAVAGSYTSATDTWINKSAQLQGTAWYGNVAAATAAAADLKVNGLAFVTAGSNRGITYSYWDSASGTVQTGSTDAFTTRNLALTYVPSSTKTITTIDTLRWNGSAVEEVTFSADALVDYASSVTEGFRTATWETDKKSVEGLVLTGGDLTLAVV